jgi:two-component system sensor histidine kinase MtrB
VRAEPFELGALVRSCLRSRGWEGRVRVEDGGVRLVSDPRRAERVVANLVENALEHGGGSDVTVRMATNGREAVVDVTDRGEGITPQDLPRLFERFAKGDPARSGPGSGLGLAIARENARLLGGDVEAASEPGVGSRFTLRLPVT